MPKIPIKCICKATAAWSISDLECLHPLQDLHIYTDTLLEARMMWRPGQMLTLLEVAAMRFPVPRFVLNEQSFWGCFSWTTIESMDLTSEDMQTVIEPDSFAGAQARMRALLLSSDRLF